MGEREKLLPFSSAQISVAKVHYINPVPIASILASLAPNLHVQDWDSNTSSVSIYLHHIQQALLNPTQALLMDYMPGSHCGELLKSQGQLLCSYNTFQLLCCFHGNWRECSEGSYMPHLFVA